MPDLRKNPTRIVILGAGFGGVYAFKKLHTLFHRNSRVKLALVNSKNYFLFTPLLHEVATGGVARENIVEPLRKVLGCCLAEFYLAEVKSIDLERQRVVTSIGECGYDYLVIALGAETNFYGTPGAQEHSFPLKSLEDAVRLKNHFIKKFEQAAHAGDPKRLDALLCFVVVGGGPTGVELAAEMSELFYGTFGKYYGEHFFYPKVRITLVQSQKELLPHFSQKMRDKSLQVLRKKYIDVRLGRKVKNVDSVSLELDTGERIATETVIWVAGVRPRAIDFGGQNTARTIAGRVAVNEYLQMKDRPEVFVLGDMASFSSRGNEELPMLAQVATREADVVAGNIKNMVEGKSLRPFRYRHAGYLVSLGQWMAIAEIKKIFFWGRFGWWLWRTAYLSKLISLPKKLNVALDWTINLFMPRDISEL